MRLFFALQPETATARAIADWRDRHVRCDGRAVPPANFHITLAFIGEMAVPAVDSLCNRVDAWLAQADVGGGVLRLDRTGYWPRPGIYWLGPSAWPTALEQLARKLGSLPGSTGGKRERGEFLPHLSLFRRCHLPPPAPTSAPAIDFRYRHFALCESRPTRTGVSYHEVAGWELTAALTPRG